MVQLSCCRLVTGLLFCGLVFVPLNAFCAEKKPAEESDSENTHSVFQTFIRVPTVSAEFWGEDGLYHGLDVTVTLQCSMSISLSKKLPEQLRVAFMSRPWEDYAKGNPTKLIKTIVMGEVQKESYGSWVEDVLITDLLVR